MWSKGGPGLTVDTIFFLHHFSNDAVWLSWLELRLTAYKRSPLQIIAALQKSFISFSNKKFQRKPSQHWHSHFRILKHSASHYYSDFSIPMPGFLRCQGHLMAQDGGWSFCFSWRGIRKEEGERGTKHLPSLIQVPLKGLLGIIPQKSTYCWSRTWSHDQPLLKARLGNIIFSA